METKEEQKQQQPEQVVIDIEEGKPSKYPK